MTPPEAVPRHTAARSNETPMNRARLVEEMSGCKYLAFFTLFAALGIPLCVLFIGELISIFVSMAQQPPLMTLFTLGMVALLGGVSYLVARVILSLPPFEKKS
jgi:NADH:ubiquinone oxidoreductase subunit 4 (subunit M)